MAKNIHAVSSVTSNPALDTIVSNLSARVEDNKQEINLNAVTSNPISLTEVGSQFTEHEKHLLLARMDMDVLEDSSDLPVTAVFMIEQIQNLGLDEAVQILKETLEEHKNDINFPIDLGETYKELIQKYDSADTTNEKVGNLNKAFVSEDGSSSVEKKEDFNIDTQSPPSYSDEGTRAEFAHYDWRFRARVEAGLTAFWSPYQEVRAVTTPYDDPSMPCETLRAYCISIVWQGIGTFINTYFAARQPAITFSSSIGQVFIYPCGLLWAAVMPNWHIPLPFGKRIAINDGPWTEKEQLFASLIYFVAGLENNIYKNIFVQKSKVYLYSDWANWGYEILLGISSSYMGFGIAGLMRSLYVYPTVSMWPTMLPTVAVNRALMAKDKKENINGWKINRYHFFFVCFVISFIYFWIPDYLFGGLSFFSWLSWISPNNVNLYAITGSQAGLGLNPVPTFDFNIILQYNALIQPFYTTLLMYIGSIISFFGVVGMWFSNYRWVGYLPINAQRLFDNTGKSYNFTRILDANNMLDKEKYLEYSPTFYSAGLLMKYGSTFAVVPFVVTFIIITQAEPLWRGLKTVYANIIRRKGSSYSNFKDPFCRMNSAYPEAPEWWFLVILVVSLVLAIVCVEHYPTETPVWSIFFSLAFNIVFLIPFLQVYSTTGAYIRLTSILELISGYSIRGNGVALMVSALFGYAIDEQCQNYITNQKVAHYGNVPPRAMFRGQLLTTFINIVITIAVVNWQVGFEGICTPTQKNRFTCPIAQGQFNDAVTWGIIGPYRVIEHIYPILKWSFLIGFVIAIPCGLFKRFGPPKLTKYFEPNIILTGMNIWAPYNLSYYTGGLYIATAFMWYIKNRYTAWWNKYNYLFNSGIVAGIAFSSIIIFFSVQYHPKDLNWWGNSITSKGLDGNSGIGRLNASLADGGYFGPRIGEFH